MKLIRRLILAAIIVAAIIGVTRIPATDDPAAPTPRKHVTQAHDDGCGSQGGAGYRRASGKCASWTHEKVAHSR